MLRAAFSSQETAGQWQYMRKCKVSMSVVLPILVKANVLGETDVSDIHPAEMFDAMKTYCRQQGLPAMQTFNGRVARILQSVNEKDPDRRAIIEVQA